MESKDHLDYDRSGIKGRWSEERWLPKSTLGFEPRDS
jgi:hypothetical protein